MKFSVKVGFVLGIAVAVLGISALPSYAQAAQDQENPRQERAAQDIQGQDDSSRLQRRGEQLLSNRVEGDTTDSDRVLPGRSRNERASDDAATDRVSDSRRASRLGDEKQWCPSWNWWCGPPSSSDTSYASDEDSDDSDDKDGDEGPDDEEMSP